MSNDQVELSGQLVNLFLIQMSDFCQWVEKTFQHLKWLHGLERAPGQKRTLWLFAF